MPGTRANVKNKKQSRQGGTAAQHKVAGRKGGKAAAKSH
jgi:hypothetical protein